MITNDQFDGSTGKSTGRLWLTVSRASEGKIDKQVRADCDDKDSNKTMSNTTAWEQLMNGLEIDVLDPGTEWWDESYRSKKEQTSFEKTATGRAMLAARKANQGDKQKPYWEKSPEERRIADDDWRDGELRNVTGKPRKRGEKASKMKSKKRKTNHWGKQTWSPEFTKWIKAFKSELLDVIPRVPHCKEVIKTGPDGQTPVLSGMGTPEFVPVKLTTTGKCSRCKRKTKGYNKARGKNRESPEELAFYLCGCKEKPITYCLQCNIVGYLDEARKLYGEFRVRDDEGNVIGLKEVPCLKKCGVHWQPGMLFRLTPPDGV